MRDLRREKEKIEKKELSINFLYKIQFVGKSETLLNH